MSTGPGPRRLGKYELQHLLGRTGMAEVWKAFDTHLQRLVALKLLQADLHNDPNFVARFEREARVVASLHHRNIVQLHDFQVSRPPESPTLLAYMVMDYIEGPTLADYIAHTSARQHFPPVHDLVGLFAAISSAVDYAHQHGVIHRDIKPANILLDQHTRSRNPMGEPLLTDFGIAKLLGTSTSLASGFWSGTELYLSPEQAQGYVGNERSDLYALGVILYELCTGTRPFQGESPTLILQQHVTATPTSPVLLNPAIPPALTMVILRGLAKDPAARFPSASAMTQALAQALSVELPEDLSPPVSPPDAMHEPTLFRPRSFNAQPGPAPSPAASTGSSWPSYAATPSTPPFAMSSVAGPNTPVTAASSNAPASTVADSAQTPIVMPPPGTTTPLPGELPHPTKPVQKRRRNNRLVVLIAALLLLLLLGSGLGTFYLLSHQAAAPAVTTNPIIGQAFFVSSGQLQEGNSQGIADELEINLSNIPHPAAGKSYFAWLLGDRICGLDSTNPNFRCDPKDPKHERVIKPTVPIFLGRLTVNNGTVHFLYPGDQQNTDLIGITSRLLITEESATSTPTRPSADQRTWRYYAEIPQTRSPNGKHHRVIDDFRDLLYDASILKSLGIRGGSDIWLLRNTEKVLEWAGSARDAWTSGNTALIHRQVIRILDYLDGITLVKTDLHANPALLVDPTLGYAPLNDLVANQEINSYVDRMNNQLVGLLPLPGVTPTMVKLARQADYALLHYVKTWLGLVHQYAKQLFYMTDAQLQQPSTLYTLDNLQTWANSVLIGRLDPSTDTLQPGVIQIHYSVQRLVTFDVKAYKSS